MTSIIHPIISPVNNHILSSNPTDLSGGCVLSLHTPYSDTVGGKWYDASIEENHGLIIGASRPDDKKGLYFDGIDDYINCGNVANITEEITVSAMISSKEIGTASGWKAINVKENSYHLRFYNRRPVFGIKDGGATQQTNTLVGDELNTDVWYNIVGTYDGQKLKIYVDGNENATAQTAYVGDIDVSINPLLIGIYRVFDLANIHECSIDQPRIMNRAWTAKEVLKYYNQIKEFYQ